MTPSVSPGEAVHDPGPLGCAIFTDIGWTTTPDCGTFNQPVAPAVPVLVSPEDGATNQIPPVTFDWNGAARADAYDLQVSLQPNFQSPDVSVVGISETTYTVENLLQDTTYYWRVRSSNDVSNSEYSIVYQFSTAFAPPPPPALLMPEDGASDVPANPTLAWSEVETATSYDVQVSTTQDFAAAIVDSSLADTSLAVSSLASETQYFWRVRGVNSTGPGDWSTTSTFATGVTLPPAPELLQPAAGAMEVDTSIVLEWQSVPEAATYHAQLASDSTFANLVVDVQGIDSTSLPVTGLAQQTTYYWRVRSEVDDSVSPWSTAQQFTTLLAVPVVPVPIAPADGAEDIEVPTTFLWTDVAHAEFYEVELAGDSAFNNVVFEIFQADTTRLVVDGLALDATFFWRVRAVNPAGRSLWTIPSEFNTEADTTNVSAEPDETVPSEFGLGDVYPNPFNDHVTITMNLPRSVHVRLSMYDVTGKRVGILVDEQRAAGSYMVKWTPMQLSSGVYLVRMEAEGSTATRMLLLVQAGR